MVSAYDQRLIVSPTVQRSRPINLHLRPKGVTAPAVFDRLDDIQAEVHAQEARQRVRDVAAADRFRSCLRAICLDLDAAYRKDPIMLLGVRRDKSGLTKNAAYPDFVSARPFIDALDGLIASGYAEQVSLGTQGSGKSTRIRGTPKLRACLRVGEQDAPELDDLSDPIRLRVGKRKAKKRVGFDECAQTKLWRANLKRINRVNAGYHLAIDMSPSAWAAMEAARLAEAEAEAQRERKAFSYERLDFDRHRLHRVFNSRDWKQGGRFYGGWWQSVPKRYRQHITINGKPTCEYDFSAIHLRLLYKRVGAPVSNETAPYDRPYGNGYRDAVKRAFNVMLNATSTPRAELVPEFSATRMGMTWHEFLTGIRKHHQPIAEFFNTGIGLELQRTDADVAEAVMLHFTDMQQPCLPIHDSFITFASLADEVATITAKAAWEVAGVDLPVKREYLALPSGAGGLVTDDISELLGEMTAYREL